MSEQPIQESGAKAPKREKRCCPTCGASMVEYKHGLSKALVEGLVRLFRQRKPVNLSVLSLTRNQWDNFQKLRYWDLVAKYREDGGVPGKGGVWTITSKGIDFVLGRIIVPRHVWTYRGERRRYDGADIGISDVWKGAMPDYEFMSDYAKKAVSVVPDTSKEQEGQLALW